MTSDAIFRASARADLRSIAFYVAEHSGVERAEAFVERIESRCHAIAQFPHSGRARDEFGPGLRSVALERRVLIVYAAKAEAVEIVRVLYGGRDVEALLGDEDSAS